MLRHVHLRPTVILRVDAHSVNGSRKHVPAVTRPLMVAEDVDAFTDPGSYWCSGVAASLLLDVGICTRIAGSADVPTNGDR